MTGQAAFAALLGTGAGAGLLLILLGLRPRPVPRRRLRWPPWRERVPQRFTFAVAAGIAVGAVTRWPVGAVLAGVGCWWMPPLLGRERVHAQEVARIEAIASWAESLRDTLASAAGLEQTILATAEVAPGPITAKVAELASRIQRGDRLPDALRVFADGLDDPTADLIVASLVLAAEQQARNLVDLLGRLASAAREQAGMRMRVAAHRARIRTSVRIIVTSTAALTAGLLLWSRSYLDPYDTALGQIVLLGVGGCFAVAFAWMHRISRMDRPQRVLTSLPRKAEP